MENLCTLLWCFCAFLFTGHCIPSSMLYDEQDVNLLPTGDDLSREVRLDVPILFYGTQFKSIYINTNGLLSFQTEIPHFFNFEFPLDYPVIAPLYSNIDTTGSGTISHYETDADIFLDRATTDVIEAFSEAVDFIARNLFVITWKDVGYHKNGTDKLNTFQVAIITGDDDTYVEFLYPEDGIQWIQGTGDGSGLPDARSQAGIVAPDGRFYVLPGSGTDRVKNLDKWSNMNLPGQWIFRVGQVRDETDIELPDINNSDFIEKKQPKRCSEASTQCHSQAKCTDYDEGFCCACKNNFYGNGKYCVRKDLPLRVNGKVNGEINGIKFSNLDLQSYIVMQDARTYTAVSKIPEEIGFDIQSLQILGSTIGWLFAKPIGNGLNGFQLTGGVFNHTADIHFASTNQNITIVQKYAGLDVFDRLRLDVDIQGEIPRLPENSNATVTEYNEQYTLTGPGIVQSSTTRSLRYNDSFVTNLELLYSINQNFVFNYCKYNSTPLGLTWKLRVGRNFINYESREQIIRFGLSNKIGPLDDVNPCDEATCGPNSGCVVENESHRCICHPGYQEIYQNDQAQCVDVNECQQGTHNCDYNAECINEIGSFRCVCNVGFEGDGQICQNTLTCEKVTCPENSVCVQTDVATCQCLPGFTGTSQYCLPMIGQTCYIANNCSPFGYCAIVPETGQYSCFCLPEYSGDGYSCQLTNNASVADVTPTTESFTDTQTTLLPETETPPIPVIERCLLGVCWCPEGYKKQSDTIYCIPKEEAKTTEIYGEERTEQVISLPEVQCFNSVCFCPKGFKLDKLSNICYYTSTEQLETKGYPGANYSCNIINNCDVNAQCLFSASGKYHCVCNPGFEGDGSECRVLEVSCLQSDICDIHATCKDEGSTGRHICVCNSGYQGDGLSCQPMASCATDDDCPDNEKCLYTAVSQGYECVCKEGMTRDSQHQCINLEGTCGAGECVENAECLYDDKYQIYYCSCKSGYMGDGITECRPRPLGCNVVNNCGLNANCEYDETNDLYQCQCAQGFYGDGFLCYSEKNCHIDPYLCDVNARCVASAATRYVCECNLGYSGNGTVCKEIPKHNGNFLLLNQGMATLKIPFEPSRKNFPRPIQVKANQVAVGLDADCFGGRIYWSDLVGKAIRSSTYNGTDKKDFVYKDIGSPEGISIDWVSRNIYWTDSTKDTIEVANIETNLRTTLIDTDLINPRGIAVHPQRGKIFWSDWNRKNPKIEWANSDGTGREIFLHGSAIKLPNSLAIDFSRDQLCYADAGTKNIECVDIDTKARNTIASNCTYPFGIAATDQQIYWSDWITKKIEHVDKQTLKRLPPINVPLGGGGNKLYEVVAVPDKCPNLLNICYYYKDQCPIGYICLPDGKGSRRCTCGSKIDSLEQSTCKDI